MVVFEVVNGRRVEPIGAQQLDNLRKHQEAVGQALLAQQFQMLPATSTMSSSSAMRDYAIARSLAARGHRFFLPNRAGVGYRPQITMLPQGTNFTAMGPVVSPDRRYIRITIPPIPISMGVGDVKVMTRTARAAAAVITSQTQITKITKGQTFDILSDAWPLVFDMRTKPSLLSRP